MDLKQIFDNNFDCYADTWKYNDDTTPPSMEEGDVVLAMTKETFVEVVEKLFKDRPSSNIEQIIEHANKIIENRNSK